MRVLIGLVLTLIYSNSYSIEIDDFKAGLMCAINQYDMGWVCFEQEEIQITGQSFCVAGGNEFKCTWFGYSFKYKNAKIGQEINCVHSSSSIGYEVNKNTWPGKLSLGGEFSFTLDKEEGSFVNPLYAGLRLSKDNKPEKVLNETVCKSDGKFLYKYRVVNVFPPRIATHNKTN